MTYVLKVTASDGEVTAKLSSGDMPDGDYFITGHHTTDDEGNVNQEAVSILTPNKLNASASHTEH